MVNQLLRTAWRNWQANRTTTVINLTGLALGLAGCLLVTAYVLDELNYDGFHQHADRIVLVQQFENTAASGGKFATDLKARFGQIESAVRLTRANLLVAGRALARYEPAVTMADSNVFRVFSFALAQGNPQTALLQRDGVVLSEAMARAYFPGQNPLGQTLAFGPKALPLHVTGVLARLPANSHIQPDCLVPYGRANDLLGYDVTTNYWGGTDTHTYLLLAPGTAPASLTRQLPAYVKSLNDPNAAIWKLTLVPLRDLYLRTNLIAQNRLTYVYAFGLIAALILGLALFNYVNLTTARAVSRAKEVGVRRVLGSTKGQLWRQFVAEAALAIGVSLGLAMLLVGLSLPFVNALTSRQLTISAWLTPGRVSGGLVGLLLVSLLAGTYPGLVLARFEPVAVLKGQLTTPGRANRAGWVRRGLVVGQFVVSVGMIVATLVVYSQLRYVQQTGVGYQRAQILTMDLRDTSPEAKARFEQQVESLAGVRSATRAFGLPGSGASIGTKLVNEFFPKGAKTGGIQRLTIDADYLNTFGIKLLAGRNFDVNRSADKGAFLVNRAAMRYFGWTDIVGKRTGYYTFAYDPKVVGGYREVPQVGEVIGLIEDYNHADLKRAVEPMIFSLSEGWESQLAINLRSNAFTSEAPEVDARGVDASGMLVRTLGQIERLWKTQFPDRPFTYAFLDDTFNQTYQTDVRTGQVFGIFAGLALLISCLGLFGLAAFSAARRTKEIGVRKVLGASVTSVVTLLARDFLTPVLLAILIASPLAGWAMSRWLNTFAYRIHLTWWLFASAGALAVLIALLTVGYQSIRAALMNPVKSLRSE